MASTANQPTTPSSSSRSFASYPTDTNHVSLTDSQPSPALPDPPIPSHSALPSQPITPSPTHSNPDGVLSTNPPSRPVLVQLGSAISAAPTPQPKKFAASNINKKFLEKNSSTPTGPGSSSSLSSSVKLANSIARPPTQSSSHPRLITTKLTTAPQPSSTPGPGWSRPSSVTPPVSTPALNGTPAPTQTATNASHPSAPQLPHVGKVIQPQPRSAAQASSLKDGLSFPGTPLNKPVWGNVKSTTTRSDLSVQNDFPTAAEVAHARKPKVPDSKEVEVAEANKQARMEEADTFRGVHLDPNAHHWDEIDEDDDNFLDGVIEFGDGRQYKIDTSQHSDAQPIDQSSYHEMKPGDGSTDNEPVRKEDRFVDDFDRSWPRMKSSPSSSNQDPHLAGAATSPSSNSAPLHSPQESSRVLFNERSNRLEPYSSTKPNQGPYQINKRSHHSEQQDARGKPVGESSKGSRFGFDRPREGTRRESFTSHSSSSPRLGHDALPPSASAPDNRGRRLSNMGPPPVPPHARGSGFKEGRQLPPHLSQPLTSGPAERPSDSHSNVHRTSSRSSSRQRSEPSGFAHTSTWTHSSSESSALMHTPATTMAALSPETPLKDLSSTELDDARKDLMHSAAERARQRRQQEEEERERERERARQKALLLEQKMTSMTEKKAEESHKAESSNAPDDKAASFINDAIATADRSGTMADQNQSAYQKPPSRSTFHESPRVSFSRRLSSASSHSHSQPPNPPTLIMTPSTTAESWRTKSNPPAKRQNPPPPPPFASPPPSALDQVQSLAEGPEADLEVVDYSDLAKFVGSAEPEKSDQPSSAPVEETSIQSSPEQAANIRARRPVASDFFEKENEPASTAEVAKVDTSVWRRNVTKPDPTSTLLTSPSRDEVASSSRESTSQTTPSEPAVSHSTLSHFNAQRNSRTTGFYKESTISTLVDTMSRIKGAMQASEKESQPSTEAKPDHSPKRQAGSSTKLSGQKDKWVPPALRPPRPSPIAPPVPQEEFLATGAEPPPSPKPVRNAHTIRLPKVSKPSLPIPKKQLVAFHRFQPVRFDVLSFVPPVEGMSRRDFSVNDVLFRRPYGFNRKMKYKVSLPKNRIDPTVSKTPPQPQSSMSTKPTSVFGKPPAADGASSWRKPVSSTVKMINSVDTGLDTTSRSPPPEPESETVSVKPPKSEESTMMLLRARSQPKMPEGSGVAFYRDSRVVAVVPERKPSVSFFATSEPEEVSSLESKNASKSEALIGSVPVSLPSQSLSSGLIQSSLDTASAKSSASTNGSFGLPSLVKSSKTDSKSSGDSPDRVPITPPSHHPSAPWARSSISLSIKESPVRAPDPEHLKKVWSQTSNKADLHPVNSLEGIVDDLGSVPFTIQDVKSENGETPPPTALAPSRMSLHDVTRAFQQVPSSANISSHRPTISPPSTSAPVARPSTQQQNFSHGYSMPNQPANQNVRSAYPYPSPMLSNSPAPVPMYSHPMTASPIPGRMQVNGGHTPLYSPVWMSLPNAPTQNSAPANMMRPMASAYPPQPMPYHSPVPHTQPMYGMPANMQNPPSSQNNNTPNRGRNMPMNHNMISPVMNHAHPVPPMPMYMGSPVMMPAHAGRGGQGRNDSHSHSNVTQHHQSSHPSQPQPYSTLPGNSFSGVRPTW
ncbi:hypothetical protein K435DRAFT_261794 [Dendrothele bispora CBS 962.96]|uniref:Uncharacterized protein n=1 Tax=Dendrothele bispora (strain CBS 962.96) TaxID=1314807 RepID=A0A4S8MY01_DENBC|nr:hypothetical protein K435DRAFT_261794 [Dendrothele bispora CBS 962.96]